LRPELHNVLTGRWFSRDHHHRNAEIDWKLVERKKVAELS
jgi:hypothetical protein